MVEQFAVNEKVASSNLAPGARSKKPSFRGLFTYSSVESESHK